MTSFSHINGQMTVFDKSDKILMLCNKPVVQRYFTLEDIQHYICVLEQAISDERRIERRFGLQDVLSAFIVSLEILKENHEAFIAEAQAEDATEAPSEKDLEAYLLYARSISTRAC